MSASKPVTDSSWTSDVLQNSKPVLVDFWAEWCGPCRKVSPLVDEIATEMGDKIDVVKLNIDENQNTARDYGVMSIPTLMIFKGGEAVQSLVGVQPKNTLLKAVESAL